MSGKRHFADIRRPDTNIISSILLFVREYECSFRKIDLPGNFLLFLVGYHSIGLKYQQLVPLIFFFEMPVLSSGILTVKFRNMASPSSDPVVVQYPGGVVPQELFNDFFLDPIFVLHRIIAAKVADVTEERMSVVITVSIIKSLVQFNKLVYVVTKILLAAKICIKLVMITEISVFGIDEVLLFVINLDIVNSCMFKEVVDYLLCDFCVVDNLTLTFKRMRNDLMMNLVNSP